MEETGKKKHKTLKEILRNERQHQGMNEASRKIENTKE